MTEGVHPRPLPELDDPWRRLPWVTLAAITIWIGLLAAFSFLLERAEPPPPELKPIEARIVELPSEVGGLAGGGGGAPPHAVSTPAAPKPKVAPHVAPASHPKRILAPPLPVSPNGTATNSAATAPPAAASSGGGEGSSGGSSSSGGSGASGNGGNGSGNAPGGIGTDNLGAHAIYAPVPVIPDELREDAIQTEAVAHFKVTFDGQVTVSLARKTPEPRLNKIILDTLEQWRFFPAMKDGVAIDSEFDLKIPISVQ